MKAKRVLSLLLIWLLAALLALSALAEDTPAPAESPAADTPAPEDAGAEAPPAASAWIPAPDAADPDLSASAANAAVMLREGTEGARYEYWETALGHAHNHYPLKKAAVAMLKYALGKRQAVPVGRDPVKLQNCSEVPLPADGQELEKDKDYNLHAAIYASAALTSVTAVLSPQDEGREQSVTLSFDPAAGLRRWSIDESWQTVEQSSINEALDFGDCAAGRWTLSISAATVDHPEGVPLYSASFKIVKVKEHMLNQNVFDDNWDEALAFFGGDTSQFLFAYFANSANSEFISTDTEWRESHLVKSNLHGARVHVMALEHFNLAAEYLESSYIKVYSPKYENPRLIQLDKLVGNAGSYVPRFQKNQEYVSHHTLGTAVDVNSKMYPNTNVITNHELIGTDVREHLRYDGIMTDEDSGQQYYQFTYTGSYRAYTDRVPNTIINDLLYELAFYRAGFSWGYYYETACDAMHFMLSELDIHKHIDSDVGLRKVYEYYN
ncbi:MAG: M15 family metallopeptidase [Clostridia bacterium]|nr:M15 family metallopeptidase [Clostridia bacterium]